MLAALLISIVFTGGIQSDHLFPTVDISSERTEPRPSWAKIDHLSNTYADFGLRYDREPRSSRGLSGVDAKLRLEFMQWPLLGYEPEFRGYGLAHLSLTTRFGWGNLTLGDVYGQFGSGLILRLYEERSLGVDNALRGGRLDVTPLRGWTMTVLGGKQRRYWSMYDDGAWGFGYRRDAVLGADLNLDVHEWSSSMQQAGAFLTLGASWVSRYEQADTTIVSDVLLSPGSLTPIVYNVPRWVGATDVRAQFQMRGWSVLAEFAYKANDPSIYNDYSFAPGHALLLSLSYSRRGLSVLVQAKRTENMYFSSVRRGLSDRRTQSGCGFINHLPSFAYQHTYALAAIYPYATQMDGEWAMQGEIRYLFARRTVMGGRYGTTLKLNASHVRGLADRWLASSSSYYTDVNIELNKKISQRWQLNAMLMYQGYNATVIEGHGGYWHNGIAVLDAKFVATRRVQMRVETQYLYSRQGEGQRFFALYEQSMTLPHDHNLMISLQDQYVIGRGQSSSEQGENYYSFQAAWQYRAHRLTAAYGKSRAGYNCSGGVCRWVPQQQGVSLSYNFTW